MNKAPAGDRAYHYVSGVLGFAPRLRLLALFLQAWRAHTDVRIYGMPRIARGEAPVVGAQMADFFRGISRMLDGVLTPVQRAEMETVYGRHHGRRPTRHGPFADLLVVHELGHLYHEQVLFGFARLWLMELFAHVRLYAYVAGA